MRKNPIQPVILDKNGVKRFKENKIVVYLLDNGAIGLNDIAIKDFSQDDREQFAQLIGYSVGGFSELSYVSNETYNTANNESGEESDAEKRNNSLRDKVESLERGVAKIVINNNINTDDYYD